LVSVVKMLPPSVKDRIETLSRGDDTAMVGIVAQEYAVLKQASPLATLELDEDTRVFLESVVDAQATNANLGKHIEATRNMMRASASDIQERKARLVDVRRDQSDQQWLNDNRDIFELQGSWRRLWFDYGFEEEFPTEFVGPFSSRVETFFLMDPKSGIQKARERALEDSSKVWGGTRVGVGQESRFMYLAPERTYPELTSDQIHQQLIADVSENRPDLAEFNLSERLILGTDIDSPREVDPETRTLAPGYGVFLIDEDGLGFEPIFRADGSAMRFYPDVSEFRAAQPALQTIETGGEAKASQLEAAKEARKKADRVISERRKAVEEMDPSGLIALPGVEGAFNPVLGPPSALTAKWGRSPREDAVHSLLVPSTKK